MTVCQLLPVFWNNRLNIYLMVFMNHIDTSQLGKTYQGNFMWCWKQVMLCTVWFLWLLTSYLRHGNVLYKAACINSVVHACLEEVILIQWRICSAWLCSLLEHDSLLVRITHNLLCCVLTRTKFMDSLFTCFIAHLSLTLCYSLCNQ